MTSCSTSIARCPLAIAMVLVLLAPVTAPAQTNREQALEARVGQLEAQARALLSSQQQQATYIIQSQGQIVQAQAQLDEVHTSMSQPAVGKQPIQGQSVVANAVLNTTFSNGFIKMDGIYTGTSGGRIAEGSARRLASVPSSILVSGPGAGAGNGYTDSSAHFSRFDFSNPQAGPGRSTDLGQARS